MNPSLRRSIHLVVAFVVCLLVNSKVLWAQTTPTNTTAPPNPPNKNLSDASADNTSYYAKQIIPNSPDVASLGKYVDVPVNNYTGTPDISIPLYTIKTRDLQVPLSLNYHGGGIHVEEEASSIGLGWSLSSGGVIQHSIRGKDDFIDFDAADSWKALNTTAVQGSSAICYFLSNTNASWFIPSATTDGASLTNKMGSLFQMSNGQRIGDTERDIFSFSFPGRSGKFVIEPLGSGQYTIRQLPQSDLRIELNKNPAGNVDLSGNSGFVITDTDGTRYTFSTREVQRYRTSDLRDTGKRYNSNAPGVNPVWGSAATPDAGWFSWQPEYAGAWYLTEIRSVKNDVITFGYTTSTSFVGSLPGRTENYTTNGGSTFRWSTTETQTKTVYPQSITFANGVVTFSSDTRQDLMAGSRRITGMEVKANNSSAATVKKFQFNQDYFDSGSGAETFLAKRLKLLTVQEITGGTCIPPYLFTYETSANLPNKDSYAQDYWGFFNGETVRNDVNGGTPTSSPTGTMLPDIVIGNNQYKLPFRGANRKPNQDYMRANVLTQITYPTGGTAQFDLQPHVVSNLAYDPNQAPYYYIRIIPSSGGNSTIGGGLRINSVTTTSAAGITQKTTYNYNYSGGASSGKLMANMQLIDWVYFPGASPGTIDMQVQYSSSPRSPMGSGAQGNCVGYTYVSVYKGNAQADEGYSVYVYTNEPDNQAADFCVQSTAGDALASCSNSSPSIVPSYQCDPVSRPQYSNTTGVSDPSTPTHIYTLNGSLEREEHYKGANTLVKQILNEYEVANTIRVKNFRLMKRSNIYSSFIYFTDSEWPRITKSIVNDYGGGASTTLFTSTTTVYGYNSTGAHKQVTSLVTTDKSGEKVTVSRVYPPDAPVTTTTSALLSLNMLSAQLQESETLTKTNNTTVPVKATQTSYNTFSGSTWLAPQTVQSQVGSGSFITDATLEYTAGGDVSALTDRDGIRTTFEYYGGSGKTALLQKSTLNEGQASAKTTTYDYAPLIGVSQITDPKGQIMYYFYDGYSRLTQVRDYNYNIVKAYTYNYANSGCSTKQLGLFPDLTPIVYADPPIVYGTKPISMVVQLVELNNIATNGLIRVYVTKDSKVSLSFSSSATTIGGRAVQNNVWNFDGSSNSSYYILTTNQSVAAGNLLAFGLTGTLTPAGTSGKVNLSASLEGGSGGETRVSNNIDVDAINYFPN